MYVYTHVTPFYIYTYVYSIKRERTYGEARQTCRRQDHRDTVGELTRDFKEETVRLTLKLERATDAADAKWDKRQAAWGKEKKALEKKVEALEAQDEKHRRARRALRKRLDTYENDW